MSLLFIAIPILIGAALLPALFDSNDDGPDSSLDDDANTFRGTDEGEVLAAGEGFDNVDGAGGDDTIDGGPGKDLLFGGAGSDSIDGGGWNDGIVGGSGDDTLVGGVGADVIFGEAGNDSITGDGWADVLYGGEGADTLQGGVGNDELSGGFVLSEELDFRAVVDLRLAAEEDEDGEPDEGLSDVALTAFHDGQVDILDGGEGNDTLLLGAGDEGTGGAGADTFEVFYDPSLGDTPPLAILRDFNPAEDRIEVALVEDDDLPVVEIADEGVTGNALLIVNSTVIARIEGVEAGDIELDGSSVFYSFP